MNTIMAAIVNVEYKILFFLETELMNNESTKKYYQDISALWIEN